MGRPRRTTPHTIIEHPIPTSLLNRLHALLTPPGHSEPAKGSRARTINSIILRYVQGRETLKQEQRPGDDGGAGEISLAPKGPGE